VFSTENSSVRFTPGYARRARIMVGEKEGSADASPKAPERAWSDEVLAVPYCPPTGAVATGGAVYRRVTPEGHKTWAQLRRGKRNASDSERCEYAALTVFVDIDALRAAAKVHAYMAEQPIAVAVLTSDHGVIARTCRTPGHHSLWLRRHHLESVDALFKVLP
jgi:hypothetical protein